MNRILLLSIGMLIVSSTYKVKSVTAIGSPPGGSPIARLAVNKKGLYRKYKRIARCIRHNKKNSFEHCIYAAPELVTRDFMLTFLEKILDDLNFENSFFKLNFYDLWNGSDNLAYYLSFFYLISTSRKLEKIKKRYRFSNLRRSVLNFLRISYVNNRINKSDPCYEKIRNDILSCMLHIAAFSDSYDELQNMYKSVFTYSMPSIAPLIYSEDKLLFFRSVANGDDRNKLLNMEWSAIQEAIKICKDDTDGKYSLYRDRIIDKLQVLGSQYLRLFQ